MASVFLSYDRDDAQAAGAVAAALEDAGHAVWWDLHLRGGAQFSKVIEEALNAADAVLVLWSANAIESPWVRDEAAVGRDTGRLVPLTIDATQAPLGFRQFHTIDMSGWNGRGGPAEVDAILDAIDALENDGSAVPVRHAPPGVSPHRARAVRTKRWPILAVLAAVVVFLLGLLLAHPRQTKAAVPVVAVVAGDHSGAAGALARDLLVKLGSLSSAEPGSIRMTGEARNADYVFKIAGDNSGPRPSASLMLVTGNNKSLLWSQDLQQQSGNAADLRQQAAVTAARVLGCTVDGLPRNARPLPEPLLKQYLNACALLEETLDDDPTEAIGLLEEVTRQAPDFKPAWAKLLVASVNHYQVMTPAERKRAAEGLKRQIAEARRADPRMPEAYIAEIELLPGGAFGQQVELADRAVKADPRNVAALSGRSLVFLGVGRQTDAVEDARRAVDLDPLSPARRNAYIQALIYSGRTDAARRELVNAEKLWPGTSTIAQARYRFNLRAGDAKEALELIRDGAQGGQAEASALESFLRARTDPTDENVDRALSLARASYKRSPNALGDLVQTLGEFHRTDELINVLLSWNDPSEVPYFVEVLFRPALRDLRFDPRIMLVAKRFGLLKYWRSSGNWPDFCFEPDLPYDCKKEAARLTA